MDGQISSSTQSIYAAGSRWVDPAERVRWFDDLQNGPSSGADQTRRVISTDQTWMDYQRQWAGPEEYLLRSGDRTIWADSVHLDPDGVAAIDAKFIKSPGSSIYEGSAPPKVVDAVMKQFDGEMTRYAEVINDDQNPVARLRLYTSTPEAAAFLTERARAIVGPDIDLQVVLTP